MDSLFNKINCDRSAITDMLGGTSGVTDANMMQVAKEFAVFSFFIGLIYSVLDRLISLHNLSVYCTSP